MRRIFYHFDQQVEIMFQSWKQMYLHEDTNGSSLFAYYFNQFQKEKNSSCEAIAFATGSFSSLHPLAILVASLFDGGYPVTGDHPPTSYDDFL